MDNKKLVEMAGAAKENWIFHEDTDPDGSIQLGLNHILTNPHFSQEKLDDWFKEPTRILMGWVWDSLQDFAQHLGKDIQARAERNGWPIEAWLGDDSWLDE